MRRPFKRYCFHLAEKLGRTMTEVMEFGSDEITEWMAFDLTNSKEWLEKYNSEQEMLRQRNLPNEDKARLLKQLLGGN